MKLFSKQTFLLNFILIGMSNSLLYSMLTLPPLHKAVEQNNLEQIKQLANDTTINVKDTAGNTPLHKAVQYDRQQIACWLLEHGAKKDSKNNAGWTPLHTAAQYNSLAMIRFLVRAGADINAVTLGGRNTPLHVVAYTGSTPLHVAAYWKNLEAVYLFVRAGANIQAKSSEEKIPAQVTNNRRIEHILNVRRKKTQALFQALVARKRESARNIVMQDIAIGMTDKNGDTLLHCAVRNEWPEIARILVQLGANPMVLNYEDETPMNCNIPFWFNHIFGTDTNF